MDAEFLAKLKESFITMDKRISALEHLVNDVVIGGLQDAADEYLDDERFSEFTDTYGDSWKDLTDPCKVLYGETFDLGSDLYDKVKEMDHSTEGFDEKAEVEKLLAELRTKLSDLEASIHKPEEESKDDVEEVPNELELKRIYKQN